MCGIVGLLIRDHDLDPELGRMFSPMLMAMEPRGPDSAGAAFFPGAPDTDHGVVSVLDVDGGNVDGGNWGPMLESLRAEAPSAELRPSGPLAHITVVDSELDSLLSFLATCRNVRVMASGSEIEVVKQVGSASSMVERQHLEARGGHIAVGHTRMATESAVSAEASHPFAPGNDLALVHNGSFSNYATIRRQLRRDGVTFDSDNDSEVCARLIASSLDRGAVLEDAMGAVADRMDGFYTLLAATPHQMALARDVAGCKPAVVAEHPGYVAVASEYHALTSLPGIGDAHVYEPAADSIVVWTR